MKRLLLLLPALAFPCLAAQIPPTGPHAPVSVNYHILNAQSLIPANFTVLFAPGGRAARISFAGQPGYVLVDAASRQMTLVLDQPAISFAIPTPAQLAPFFDWRRNLAFSRGPRGSVEGRACNWWNMSGAQGQGRVCFSPDGVPLRIEASGNNGTSTTIEASTVVAANTSPAEFQVPADHTSIGNGGFNLSPFAALGANP